MNDIMGGLCDRCKELEETQPIAIKEVLADDQVEETFTYDPSQIQDPIIGRVPLEISSYIFELYVQLHTQISSVISKSVPRGVPLDLGAICRTWRRIAWSLPRLWTTLQVDISSGGCRYSPELASEWIKRTGTLPLSIYLYDSDNSDTEFNDTFCSCVGQNAISLIKVLNLVSSRWEELALSIPSDLVSYIDDSGPDDGQPSILRRLYLDIEDGEFGSKALFKKSSRKHSPREISLELLTPLDAIDVHWTNLIEFHVGELTHEEIHNVIQHAPLLQICTFDFNTLDSRMGGPKVMDMSIAKSLRSMSIFSGLEGWDEAEMGHLLDCLTLPSLERLSFSGDSIMFGTLLPIENLISLIQRSHCQLQHLNLRSLPMTETMAIRAFQAMPTLKSLEFVFERRDETSPRLLLEHLGRRGPAGTGLLLLPNLKSLRLDAKQTFFWPLVAKLFGPISSSNTPYPSQRHDLEVDINVFGSISKDYIDRTSLICFMHLLRCGVDINISILKTEGHGYNNCNLIEESHKFYFPRAVH